MSSSAPPASYAPAAGTFHRPATSNHPLPQRRQADDGGRAQLIGEASRLNEEARAAAERGDVPAAARAILQALDCERRAGGLGPQVLQLIKPRS